MTEIRPIRESEGEEFLQLLCGVFSLDVSRARAIFYTEPLFDLNRKWALFEGKEMVSILTTTPLKFGWGNAYGIAGVATKPEHQGEGHASKLLERVFKEATHADEGASLLFAKDVSLYERNGYEAIDRVVRARIHGRLPKEDETEIEVDSMQVLYNQWAEQDKDRLRRDDRRWKYWKWHFRVPTRLQNGYLCPEPGVLREAYFATPEEALPVPDGSDWYGTAFMTDALEIPLAEPPRVELFLMGKNFPGVPQMFMTDQF